MGPIWIILIFILAGVISLGVSLTVVSFVSPFYSSKKKRAEGCTEYPTGEVYLPYEHQFKKWAEDVSKLPYEELSIKSFDGLTLRGRYYEYSKDSPVEIMFHGYRGSAKRDMRGGVVRAFNVGHSAIVVDQRGCGQSEGKVISFGINESRDCLGWVKLACERLGRDRKIILTGISMGASTVLIAAGRGGLPENVVGVLADCGFSSAKEIIYKIVSDLNFSARIFYPFIRFSARLLGRFNVDEISAAEAVRKCTVPVLFIHGEDDVFVPPWMGEKNFNACAAPKKKFVKIKGAGHGVAYPAAPEQYEKEVREFFAYVSENGKTA